MYKYYYENDSIESERLFLRYFEASDAERITEICNNFNLYKYTLSLPYPYSLNCAKSWLTFLKNELYYANVNKVFAITLKGESKLIGCISLDVNIPNKHAELGYWVDEKYWNKGFCTEAATALIRYGFEELKLRRIQAKHLKINAASGKVMQKAGMKFEGVMRDYIYKDGVFHDIPMYSILNEQEK